MRFNESHEGEYRIYVGALEAPRGDGYIAAIVVSRLVDGEQRLREAYRDDSIACGYRWPNADEAMSYAMTRAREMIRSRSQMLAY